MGKDEEKVGNDQEGVEDERKGLEDVQQEEVEDCKRVQEEEEKMKRHKQQEVSRGRRGGVKDEGGSCGLINNALPLSGPYPDFSLYHLIFSSFLSLSPCCSPSL